MSGKKTIVTLLRVSLLACPLLFTTPSFASKRKLTAVCSHQTRIGNLDAHLI